MKTKPSYDYDTTSQSFEKNLRVAANRTWDVIGDDVLRAKSGSATSQKPDHVDYSVEMSRDDVIWCVADYITTYGELSPEDNERWRKLSRDDMLRILRDAFKCDVYGY